MTAVATLAIMTAGWLFMERNESHKLLNKMALLTPGTHLDLVKDQLGQEIHAHEGTTPNDVEYMMRRGRIQNPVFLQDKKQFWFYASTPPCRVVEVYTDKNNIILFVTWQQL